MNHSIGYGKDFREQLTETEFAKYLTDMAKFLKAFNIQLVRKRVDDEGITWLDCATKDDYQRVESWILGYAMALGFDEDGNRTKL